MNLKKLFPILDWVSNYKKSWLKGDINAGITVGVMLIPQGIAYAIIAGLPPIYGLYTAMIPQLIYAVFGTSRQLAVGPAAMDSLIVAASIMTLAEIGTDHFVELAILLAFTMGAFQVLFGFLRLGFLVNFLSKPVISGFTSAAALIIGLNQVKNLTGINLPRDNEFQVLIVAIFKHLKEIHWPTFMLGLSAIATMLLFKKYFKRTPSALIVVVLSIIIVKFFHLEQYGIAVIGDIPSDFPSFVVPTFDKITILKLYPMALTLAFVSYLEAISLAKAMETKHNDYKVRPNQELIAIGMSNIIGSFFQSYSATGGFSRTAVNNEAGAKTPLASIISALIVGFIILFMTPAFYHLPKATLGAIILVAMFGLFDITFPKKLWAYAKKEFLILLITFIITAAVGIKEGILTGIVLSLIVLIYRSTMPHVAVLGQVENTHFYRNIARFTDVIIKEDILIFRFDAQLHFTNVAYFKEKLYEVANKKEHLKLIVIDSESMNIIDSAAVTVLEEILDYFHKKGIEVYFTGFKGPVRDILKKSGLITKLSYDRCFMSIQEAIDCFENPCSDNVVKNENKYSKFVSQANDIKQ